ncbi:WD40 repeat-like protein [Gonapodya prolifera JEL478]|uniref:WD40 repeat-like protein n=1 Tax=Gonapodya prolifera (strain JEL478) TaxID=1344416 RepID=A0A139AV80_GONPJ|nr:WD40 repeat-like protein [Gonapodya prolifera JEL478]|eukprot:KXS20656.1 WD40 repeat-like protein [Gonapodya prolifera JEL478]
MRAIVRARFYSRQDGTTKALFKGHKGPVTCIAAERDSHSGKASHLWSGSWDKSIIKWDLATNAAVLTTSHHTDFVKSIIHVQATPTSPAFCVSCSSDSTIRYFTPEGVSLRVLKQHTRSVEALCVDESMQYLYSASSDTTIRKWALETGEELAVLQGHLTSVYGVWWARGTLWSASADKTARQWDAETNQTDSTFEHPDFVKAVAVDPSGRYLFTGGRDQDIRVWDTGSEKLVTTILGHFDEVSVLECTGTTLWSGSLDGTVRRWTVTALVAQSMPDNDSSRTPQKQSDEDTMGDRNEIRLTEEEERELAELAELAD